ncbi:uncharacterized protein LOC134958737 isoform X2 [Pseudophryne corroboree]|uniref:uncharacterized protein LOC134958737 isoform X2 n=1 Tax=Pseudophryne corroboree TaxID=495146 RepID=UPI0030817BE0
MSPVYVWVTLLSVGVSGAELGDTAAPPPECLNIIITFLDPRDCKNGTQEKYICTPAEHNNNIIYHCQRDIQASAAPSTDPDTGRKRSRSGGRKGKDRSAEDEKDDNSGENTHGGSHCKPKNGHSCNGRSPGDGGKTKGNNDRIGGTSDQDKMTTPGTTRLSRDGKILLPILLILLVLIIVGAVLWTWKYKCQRKQRTYSARGDSTVEMEPKKHVTTVYVTASDPGVTGDLLPPAKSHHLYQEIYDVPMESGKKQPDTTYSTAGIPYDVPQPVSPAQPPADGSSAQ